MQFVGKIGCAQLEGSGRGRSGSTTTGGDWLRARTKYLPRPVLEEALDPKETIHCSIK